MLPPTLRRVLPVLLLAFAYYGAARLGLMLAFEDSNASPVWPPSGIAFGALLIGGLRLWPGVFIGALAANLVVFNANGVAHGLPALLLSAAIAAGNTAESLLGAWLVRRTAGERAPLTQIQLVYKFAILTACACAVSALVGTGALLAGAVIPPSVAWTVVGTWWLGDVVGVLVLAPLCLAWSQAGREALRRAAGIESLLSLAILGGVLALIFGHKVQPDMAHRWLAYLLVPALGWAAFRHGRRGTTLTCLVIAAGAVAGTTQGYGPFATGTLNDALFGIQTFVALCSLVGMALCADLIETRERKGELALRQRLSTHWITLFVCIGMTVLVWHMVSASTEYRAREQFNVSVAGVQQRVVERMRTYEQGLRSAKALFSASESVQRQEWRQFVDGMAIAKNFPGVQGFGFAKVVAPGQREQLERAVRADGFPQFQIWPQGEGERALAIIYLEPFTVRNQRAFGFDLLSEPVRAKAALTAEASGEPALTARLTLVQENGSAPQAGFLMFVPVYRNGSPTATAALRKQALEGVVYSPFRMDDLMQGILRTSVNDVALEIFDGDGTSPANTMHVSTVRSLQERRDYPNPFVAVAPIQLQQHQWTIRVTSLSAFENAVDRQKSQIVLVAGTIISLLFFGVVRALAAREEYAAARAAQMQSALAQSERKFESLVDSALEFSIIATDLEGVIRVFSVGAERMLGYSAAEMVGKQTPAILHVPEEVAARAAELHDEGVDAAGFAVLVAGVRRTEGERREWTYVRRDGSHVAVSLVVTTIRDAGGAAVGFLGIAHNIEQQHHLQASLMNAKELAEAASRAKSEFVANMSHEIRTPMNAVLGIAHLLGKTALTPEQRKYLDMIRSSGQSLLGIINDVLDFSKVEAGRMELAPEAFDLNSVLNMCASMMAVNAGDKELELVVSAQPQLPPRLYGDALRLQQVLTNLTSNAIKFTDKGSVSLFAEEAAREGGQIRIRFVVRDTGIGIDREQQTRLFSPFTQADASMTRRFGGTGLGLTITKSMVELMGGQIAIASVPGQGSCFSVTLPFAVVDEGAAPSRADHMRDVRLLVIEHDPMSQRGLSEGAQALGWHPTMAASGADALAELQAYGGITCPYDVIVVASRLPDMSGLEAVRACQQIGAVEGIPFVLLASAGQRQRGADLGSINARGTFLFKPVTRDGLFDAVASVLAPLAAATAPRAPGREAARATPLSALRLLLVEDNELNQLVARGILEGEGVRVVVANNGQEALDVLAHDAAFDLILMDVQMPVLDGLAATRALRGALALTMPVIAMSAGVLESERQRCLEAGMNDFVAKPIDAALLFATLQRHAPGAGARGAAPESAAPLSDVFDVQALMRLNERDPARRLELLGLIERVLAKAGPQFAAARAACERGDLDGAGKELHSLRGTVGIVGARRFIRISLQLEELLRGAAAAPATGALFDQLARELVETESAARAWLAGVGQATAG